MAKPIQTTPTLQGLDAKRFIKNMIKEQTNPTPERIKIIKRALSRKYEIIN